MSNKNDKPEGSAQDGNRKVERAVRYTALLALVGFRVKAGRELKASSSQLWKSSLGQQQFIDAVSDSLHVTASKVSETLQQARSAFQTQKFSYSILEENDESYPHLLRMVSDPPPFLFVRGDVSLFSLPLVSVVGTRTPTHAGIQRATKLATLLGRNGIAVASGLAKGIDRAAHVGALNIGAGTVAVIGTPLDVYYPSENRELQEKIALTNLLVTQFPFYHPVRQYTFPMRNYVMSGISLATVIVEAKQGSGALYQARFCLQQKRKLFLLKHLLEEPNLEWPRQFSGKPNVHIISEIDDLLQQIRSMDIYPENNSDQQFLDFKLKTVRV